jgi:uncharacterized coiled-coil protein SlyX
MSKDLKQAIYMALVLVLFAGLGVGAWFTGSRIHYGNQLYQAATTVILNAKTLQELNQSITQQQQQIEQLRAAEGNYTDELIKLAEEVLESVEPDEK